MFVSGFLRLRLRAVADSFLPFHAQTTRPSKRGWWSPLSTSTLLMSVVLELTSMPVLKGGTNPGTVRLGQLLEVADTDGT